jgi:hypothetical protein
MVYYANGGFNWHDLYFMPTKLREFYWRELVAVKDEEKKANDAVSNKAKSSSRIRRR